MKDLMFFIIVVSPLLFCIYCAWKEAEVSAPYRIFNIYGRVKVYLFTDFIAVAIVGFGSVIYSIFSKTKTDYGFLVMSVLFIFIGIGVSVFIYRSTKSKCPNGPLKDKLLISMIISGVGITFKITSVFLMFVMKIFEPQKAVDEKGRTIYIFSDDNVYDSNGNWIGKKTDTNKYVRVDRN